MRRSHVVSFRLLCACMQGTFTDVRGRGVSSGGMSGETIHGPVRGSIARPCGVIALKLNLPDSGARDGVHGHYLSPYRIAVEKPKLYAHEFPYFCFLHCHSPWYSPRVAHDSAWLSPPRATWRSHLVCFFLHIAVISLETLLRRFAFGEELGRDVLFGFLLRS